MVVVLLAAALFAPSAPAHAQCGGAEDLGEGWTRIPGPFSSADEPRTIEELHVVSGSSGHLLVSNGKRLVETRNRGCSWRVLYALPQEASPEQPFTVSTAKITTIKTPTSGRPGERIHLVVRVGSTESTLHPTTIFVLSSFDSGRSWQTAEIGPLYAGTANNSADGDQGTRQLPSENLAIASRHPDVMYLGLESVVLGPSQIFRSNDGGRTWDQLPFRVQTDLGEFPYATGMPTVKIDPFDPQHLFATSEGSLYRSEDGGISWTMVPGTEELNLRGFDLTRDRGKPWRVVGFDQRYMNSEIRSVAFIHEKKGIVRAEALGLTGGFQSTVRAGGALLLTTYDYGHDYKLGLFRFEPKEGRFGRFINIDRLGLSPLYDLAVDSSGLLYMRTAAAIVMRRST